MATIFVKPAPGRLVRMPERGMAEVPADGAEVPLTGYYRQRLAEGDLVRAKKPKAAPARAKPATTKQTDKEAS